MIYFVISSRKKKHFLGPHLSLVFAIFLFWFSSQIAVVVKDTESVCVTEVVNYYLD